MAQDRSRAELDALVRANLAELLRLAVRLTGDPDRAEDLTQEALVRVSKGFRSFRGEASFRTWSHRILVNVWRDGLGRGCEPASLPESVVDRSAPDPAQHAMTEEFHRYVAQCISRLPPRQRECHVLCVHEGYSPSEAARVLDASAGSVRVNLSLAKKTMRRMLEGYLTEK